jgi:protein ImuA
MRAGVKHDFGNREFSNERPGDPRGDLLRQLRGQLGHSVATMAEDEPAFSCGSAAIDRLLPGGGLRHGMLVEWLAELPGCGAATLGLLAAREACRAGGMLVVVDRTQAFYPPAAVGWGVDPGRLIVVRPRSMRDEIWAAVQSLRSPMVAAVWAMIDRVDSRNFRRLQLAAEAGGTLGVLVRGASARGQPSWADVRLGISREQGAGSREKRMTPCSSLPAPRRLLQVFLLRARGGRAGGSVLVEIDEAAHDVREIVTQHAPHPLPVVTELADPAAHSHPARA